MKKKQKKLTLRKYLYKYWHFALLAPLSMIGEVAVDLSQPKLMSKIVDEGVVKGDFELIWKTGLLMLGLAILGGLSGLASAAFASAASQNYGNDLRCDLFERVMRLSPEQTDKFTTGSLVTRISNDIMAVQDFVAMALRMFFRSPLLFLGGIIMMISLNVKFGIIILCSLPLVILLVTVFMLKTGPLFANVQRKLDRVNGVVQENVTGARVVKANVREEYETERFSLANYELMQSTYKVQKFMAFLMPMIMFVMNMALILLFYVGGNQIQNDISAGIAGMEVGDVMAAVTYITQILMSVMMISMMFQSISRALASSARIREVMETEPTITDGGEIFCKDERIQSIEFKNVSFNYPGFSKSVLENINIKIEAGQTVAILGSTGVGKTSLVNLIPRYYDATQGEVLINGKNVKEYNLEALREKIGYVLQKSELFSGTIEENIRWGNDDACEEEVINAAKIAQADEFITSFNHGYKTPVDEKGSSLSGGQKQRLSIARALVKNPDLLIFDDSTSALDLGTEARLQKALREKCKNTMQIIISQRVASVKGADKIIVIEGGTICGIGTHNELVSFCDVYKDICASQTSGGEENE